MWHYTLPAKAARLASSWGTALENLAMLAEAISKHICMQAADQTKQVPLQLSANPEPLARIANSLEYIFYQVNHLQLPQALMPVLMPDNPRSSSLNEISHSLTGRKADTPSSFLPSFWSCRATFSGEARIPRCCLNEMMPKSIDFTSDFDQFNLSELS